ncbi:terminase large subunit domain-containing protein [Sinomicrobium sp.]
MTVQAHKLGEELRRLKKEDPKKLQAILSQMSEEEAHSIAYDPDIWLREDQQIKDWWPEPVILFMCGRGFGKTFLGAQWLRKQVKKGVKGEIALIAPTASMVRDTMVNSGLIPLSPEEEGLVYEPSKSRITWANGTVARLVSADGGEEKLRGMNSSLIWIDELGSIPNKDVYDQAMLTLRVGQSRMLITTTPRTTETIIYLYKNAVFNDAAPQKGKFCRILTRSTYANFENLSQGYQDNIIASYEGTRLGRQELEGILLLNAENALWSLDLIARQTLPVGVEPPKLDRVAIGVDPAMSNSSKSDKTGIVVAALGEDNKAYVLEDVSGKYSPDTWVKKVHGLYDKYSEYAPTSIVVELNQGGSLVTQTLQRDRPFLPVDGVFATRNKMSRAEPVAMLYEQDKVMHCHGLADLEEEMATFEGNPRQKSPDRLDSLVMAITHLIPAQRRVTKGFEFLL